MLGDLGLGFISPCKKGLDRQGHKLFLCSQPLSQEEEWSCPALGTDRSALFMSRKGGMLWAFFTFSKPFRWMGAEEEGQKPYRNKGPFHEARLSQVMVGGH